MSVSSFFNKLLRPIALVAGLSSPTTAFAQVSTITSNKDVEAAFAFAAHVSRNDELLRIAGLSAVLTNDTSRDALLNALIKLREGQRPEGIGGRGVVAYCIATQMTITLGTLRPNVQDNIVAYAKNGKPLTVRDYGAILFDFSVGLNNGLYDGEAHPGNCSTVYRQYIR